jgi:hypothetical protein
MPQLKEYNSSTVYANLKIAKNKTQISLETTIVDIKLISEESNNSTSTHL